MLPLIYTNITYTMLFGLVFGIWATSEFLGPVRWSHLRKGETRDRGSLRVGAISGTTGVILSFLFAGILPIAALPWQSLLFFVGIAIVVAGVCWRWYAILTLKHYFTAAVMIQDGQPVIQHGPYRAIRHPSYSGVLLIVAGLGIMMGNFLSLLTITTGLLIGVLYRISIEEQELAKQLGQPYKEYMQRTRRLIPYIY